MVNTDFSPIETKVIKQIDNSPFQNTELSHIEKNTHSTDINNKQEGHVMTISVIKKPFSLKNKRIMDILNRIDGVYASANSVLQVISVSINETNYFCFKPHQTDGKYIVIPSHNDFSPTEFSVSEAELIEIIQKRKQNTELDILECAAYLKHMGFKNIQFQAKKHRVLFFDGMHNQNIVRIKIKQEGFTKSTISIKKKGWKVYENFKTLTI